MSEIIIDKELFLEKLEKKVKIALENCLNDAGLKSDPALVIRSFDQSQSPSMKLSMLCGDELERDRIIKSKLNTQRVEMPPELDFLEARLLTRIVALEKAVASLDKKLEY